MHDLIMPGDRHAAPPTILIVEDHELNMKLLHDLLEVHGYGILQAREGLVALELARQHHPSLILMDIQLPDISGLEVVRLLKEDERTRTIPIVAVTAFAMAGDEQRMLAGGCDAYVSKPISIRDFLRLVEEFVSHSQAGSAAPPC
jgi:two-component system cell cycle response regulator DivK